MSDAPRTPDVETPEVADRLRSKRLSRRARLWLLIGGGALVLLLAAAGVVVAQVIAGQAAEQEALASFQTAEDELSDAEQARDAALTARGAAAANALDDRAKAKALEAAIDPALLADAAKRDALSASIGQLEKAAAITIAADGTATLKKLPSPSAVPAQSVPADTAQIPDAVAEIGLLVEQLADETTATDAETKAIEDARTALARNAAAVVASAHEKGAATAPPELASQETKDAYAAAVAALEKPASNADLAALVTAYQGAWGAAVASHNEASGESEPDASGLQPTYIQGVLIVNKTYPLPSWYGDGLTAETQAAFNAMQAEAAAYGLGLYISSGFRSYDTQVAVYGNYVATLGQAGADRTSARPGHSEHQSGLAFDLNTIDHAFADTAEGQYVRDNAHRFGLIIRYPPNKESITGYEWEPWHMRYVGVDLATKLYTSGQTLEEYFGITSAYSG
ncbi:cytoskeletal protein RodZ [Leifsonia sp. AK011]|uniref:D-alanyl-D-alanine carboxypeptidase family protein n=1 Tax=Leifsonia sp. AK011 TaxID=2723075 RepID=UPI0015CDB6B5|nr:D-alanyl-D-alanine carboxypeptidase family protein [Leifsonia sp. AK011]NYF09438.1 cytoskeletal protein RodZ [Leifsonia sp. AK011]